MFEFDRSIICPNDPTATEARVRQYKEYYKIKYDICKNQKPKVIAEIGVRAGYSAWTFLQACPTAKYYGFDANNGKHGGQGGKDGKFFEWTKKILKPYDFKLTQLDTQTIDNLELENIDFFHVDGDHTSKGVIHDLDLAFKTLNINGMILVDDITYIKEVENGVNFWLHKMSDKIESNFVDSLRGEMLIWRRL